MDWRRLRSDFMANPAKIFYCDMIGELYCSQPGFLTLDKSLDLNSMFLKVEKQAGAAAQNFLAFVYLSFIK